MKVRIFGVLVLYALSCSFPSPTFQILGQISAAAPGVCGKNTQSAPGNPVLLIKNVTLIDGSGAKPQPGMAILIRGNRIVEIAPYKSIRTPQRALIINAKGQYAIPGLWDMHIHIKNSTASALGVLIANGVTSVRDMVGDFDQLSDLRTRIEANEIIGPRIKFSGPSLESPESVERAKASGKTEDFDKTRIVVVKPEDAAPAVRRLKEMGVDFIKIRTWESPEVYYAIARAAKEQNIQLVGHPPDGLDPIEAAKAGQESIEHGFYPYPMSKYSETEQGDIIAAFVDNNVAIVPTIIAWNERIIPLAEANAIVADDSNRLDYRRKYTAPELIEYWRVQLESRKPLSKESMDGWTNAIDTMAKDVGLMFRKGVRVMPGTDLATPLVFPGFSLHDEIGMFVTKIGMSPMEAIDSATRIPAEFMGVEDCLGTIEKGKLADLVLLDANPLQNIKNTRKISGVVTNGRYFDKAAVKNILRNVEKKLRSDTKSAN